MAKNPPKFDQARLQQMSEPFTVRVERMKGNSKSQIPLPPKEGFGVGGPGWTMEEILGLEQWIIREWSGGGTYLFQVTDSSSNPQTMEWTAVFPYPERTPPIMLDQLVAVPPVVQPTGQPAAFAPPQNQPAAAPWPPPAAQWAGMGPVPQAPAPSPGFAAGFGAPWGGGWGGPLNFGFAAPQPPATPIKPTSDTDVLKAELERMKLQQLEERHRSEVQARETAHAQQMQAMQEQLRQLKEGLTARPQGDSDELKAMKLQMEREREERVRAERAAEAERHRAEMAALEAKITANAKPAMDPEIAALKAKIEADERRRDEDRRIEDLRRQQEQQMALVREELRAAREAQNRGPDPMIMMIVDSLKSSNDAQKELARLQLEAQKEVARQHADTLRDMKSQQVAPGEMFRMLREASSGQDQIISSTVRTLNDVFSTAQGWFQQMMQSMGGGGEHPAVRLIEGGMQQVQGLAERYFQTKAQAQVAGANAQREQAKAMQAQAHAYVAAHAPAAVVQQAAAAPIPHAGGGLNGAGNGNGAVHPVGHAPPMTVEEAPAPKAPMRKGGKTDAEWFGPAIDDVNLLRGAVNQFLAAIQANPPRLDKNGHPEGIGPDQAAGFVLQAANMITKNDIKGVLAFDYLFGQAMYSDLIEVLLPDAPGEYRSDVVRYMHQLMEGKEPNDDDEDDDDVVEGGAVIPASGALPAQARA
jgi:hypothetical protein